MSTEVRAEFPAEPASAGQARRFIDATLRAWECDDLLDVAVLLASELVSNSVLHAGTTIGVVIRLAEARVRVEVRDGSTQKPARKHYSAMSTTGRGLLLVEELADDWGVAAAGAGKVVWFELSRSGAVRQAGGTHAGHGSADTAEAVRQWAAEGSDPLADDDSHAGGRPRLLVGV